MVSLAAKQMMSLGRRLQHRVSGYSRYNLCEYNEKGFLRLHYIARYQDV